MINMDKKASTTENIHVFSKTRKLIPKPKTSQSQDKSESFSEGELIPSDLSREISEKIQDLIEQKSQNEWKCTKCSKTSSWKRHLLSHLELHLDYTHSCPLCDFTTRARERLKRHYREEHNKE